MRGCGLWVKHQNKLHWRLSRAQSAPTSAVTTVVWGFYWRVFDRCWNPLWLMAGQRWRWRMVSGWGMMAPGYYSTGLQSEAGASATVPVISLWWNEDKWWRVRWDWVCLSFGPLESDLKMSFSQAGFEPALRRRLWNVLSAFIWRVVAPMLSFFKFYKRQLDTGARS